MPNGHKIKVEIVEGLRFVFKVVLINSALFYAKKNTGDVLNNVF